MTTRRRVRLTALGVGLVAALGCGIDDLPNGGAGAGGGSGGAGTGGVGGDAGGSGGSGGAGVGGADGGSTGGASGSGGQEAGPCPTLYVSPLGNDANPGCESAAPKKTVAAAIDAARSSSAVTAIWICKGTYDEALTLDVPVNLLGGHSCTTWSRTPTYGHPSFDATNETVLGTAALPQALHVTGANVASIIDGLTIAGAKSGLHGSALRISSNAAPVVSNCVIQGGGTHGTDGDGSVGLLVDSGAKPDVRHNRIDGGTGVTLAGSPKVGRAGVVVADAAPWLRDNAISGGALTAGPSAGHASVGVALRAAHTLTRTSGRPIERNLIEGGDGNGAASGWASIGVLASGAQDLDLVDNSIRPGRSPGSALQLFGVVGQLTGALGLYGNRIFGGDLSNPAQPQLGHRFGVYVASAKRVVAENNMIYGGVPIPGANAGSPSSALDLTQVPEVVLRHNTLYSGPSGFPTVGAALRLYQGVLRVTLQNNILAADASWNAPLHVEPCASTGVLERVENNLLFNVGTPQAWVLARYFTYGGDTVSPCGPWQSFATLDELTTHLQSSCTLATVGPCQGFGGVKVSGNRTLRQVCGGDLGCVTWPACDSTTSLACLQSVFAGWSASDNGLATLFGPGWQLAPALPCSITQSSLDAGVTTDLFGLARTNPPSMGAHEFDGACAP